MPDPLSQFHSPYNYAGNNPISNIDPSGMWTETATSYTTNDPDEIAAFIQQMRGSQNSNQSSNENEDEDPPKKDSKNQENNTNRPWYSLYNWPGTGSSAETMDALYEGRYGDATLWFLICAGEVFTLGYATEVKIGGQVIKLAVNSANGVSVIGPRATYRQFAEEIGANYLKVSDKAWTWTKNEKFLAEIVKRGDDVVFAGKFNPAKLDPKSVLAKEIRYLTEHGYKWTDDFYKLTKK